VADLMKVLAERCVSVRCVLSDDVKEWGLRRERGRRPECALGVAGRCCLGGGDDGLAKAYFVVELRGAWLHKAVELPACIFLRMTGRSLRMIRERLFEDVSELRRCHASYWGAGTRDVFAEGARYLSRLEGGLYSVDWHCGCFGWSVCTACAVRPKTERMFAVLNSFDGVRPFGERHWFLGVTEAADGWLTCCAERGV
jgi:hypothetical protein